MYPSMGGDPMAAYGPDPATAGHATSAHEPDGACADVLAFESLPYFNTSGKYV